MKLFILSVLATVTFGARLENTYLPPSNARTAGGSGHLLAAPSFGNFRSSSATFKSTGSSLGSGLSNAYLAPSSGSFSSGSHGLSSGQYNAAASRSSYSSGPQFRILKLNSDNPGTGSYRFEYETENQISQQEAGEQKHVGNEQAATVHGTYSYVAPDGQHITVNYVADENGFRAQGDHIPTPPPIPAEIQQSLALNAQSGGSGSGYDHQDDGAYQGIEVNAAVRTPSRQYLGPAIARTNTQGGYRY